MRPKSTGHFGIVWQKNVTSVGIAAGQGRGNNSALFANMLFAQQQGVEDLPLPVLELNQRAAVVPPFPGSSKLTRERSEGPTVSASTTLRSLQFDQEIADLAEIGRIIVAFLDAPEIVLVHHVEVECAFDVNGRDVIGSEIGQHFVAHLGLGYVPGFLVLIEQNQARAADNGQGHQKKNQLFPIHFAGLRLGLTMARTSPDTATRTGIAPILTTFVQNSRASVSLRRFLRTCFKSLPHFDPGLLIIIQFLLLFGRKNDPVPAVPSLCVCNRLILCSVSLCLVSRTWTFSSHCLPALASISLTRVKGWFMLARLRALIRSSSPASCSTSALDKIQIAVHRMNHAVAHAFCTCTQTLSFNISVSETRTTSPSPVGFFQLIRVRDCVRRRLRVCLQEKRF